MGPTNAATTGQKRKSEPEAGVPNSAESALLPLKKKRTKLTVESVQPSAGTTHGAPSNTKPVDSVANMGGKKRLRSQASDDSDEVSINTNPETPAGPPKKPRVKKPVALSTEAPICRTGKIIVIEKHALTKKKLETIN